MMMTDDEWKAVERYLLKPEEVDAVSPIDLITDRDRELAKAILSSKGHLGPLGQIEVGIALSRILGPSK